MITPRITSVIPHRNYTLTVSYENGETREFDVTPLLAYPVYQALKNIDYFMQVRPFSRTVVWPEEQDIAPELLYDGEKR